MFLRNTIIIHSINKIQIMKNRRRKERGMKKGRTNTCCHLLAPCFIARMQTYGFTLDTNGLSGNFSIIIDITFNIIINIIINTIINVVIDIIVNIIIIIIDNIILIQ